MSNVPLPPQLPEPSSAPKKKSPSPHGSHSSASPTYPYAIPKTSEQSPYIAPGLFIPDGPDPYPYRPPVSLGSVYIKALLLSILVLALLGAGAGIILPIYPEATPFFLIVFLLFLLLPLFKKGFSNAYKSTRFFATVTPLLVFAFIGANAGLLSPAQPATEAQPFTEISEDDVDEEPVVDPPPNSQPEAPVIDSPSSDQPAPAPVKPLPQEPAPSNCHPSYADVCLPINQDVDCEGGSGDGPFVKGPITIVGPDEYRLDAPAKKYRDNIGCNG